MEELAPCPQISCFSFANFVLFRGSDNSFFVFRVRSALQAYCELGLKALVRFAGTLCTVCKIGQKRKSDRRGLSLDFVGTAVFSSATVFSFATIEDNCATMICPSRQDVGNQRCQEQHVRNLRIWGLRLAIRENVRSNRLVKKMSFAWPFMAIKIR
jgi:hypothetical protein